MSYTADFSTFRLGLFGYDIFKGVEAPPARLKQVLVKVSKHSGQR